MSRQWRLGMAAPRYTPLVGVLIGAVGGGIYWLGAELWPTSIAVVLSMLATEWLSARWRAPMSPAPGGDSGTRPDATAWAADHRLVGAVLAVLAKYSVLMALSTASPPFALPENLALGLIMIAGQASSRALVVSVAKPTSYSDLVAALAIGFAPAALIGLPGLIGLVGAIMARLVFVAYIKRSRPAPAADLYCTQQLTEVCFYLSALAAWSNI